MAISAAPTGNGNRRSPESTETNRLKRGDFLFSNDPRDVSMNFPVMILLLSVECSEKSLSEAVERRLGDDLLESDPVFRN